jgi:hypothetical protein
MSPRYILIANPGTKRCDAYLHELNAFWADRGVAPEVNVVPWADIIVRDGVLDKLVVFDRSAIVRLESPSKNNDVARLMLEAGARDDPREPPCDWRALPLPKGLLVRPGLWFRGFRRVLCGLRRSFDARPHLRPTACPLEIAAMFDKTETSKRLHAAGVPVPDWLENPHDVCEHLGRWHTAYLKLNAGSSAAGIVAIHAEHNEAVGITSVAEIDGRFWNTRRLRRILGYELERVGEFILSQGAIAQRGIPMAHIDGQNFDVRIVCIRGKPAATIFRLSSHPMTNLHLGGRRGDFTQCRAMIPTRQWLDAVDHCQDAAACFDSTIAGVDLVFDRGFRNHYVLEVNAFGDFFPGWTDDRGMSVHRIEIESAAIEPVSH